MPGLIEMHAHLDDGYGRKLRPHLAGVRNHQPADSGGQPIRRPRAARGVRRGTRPGPRVFIAGDPFDAARVYYPGGVSVTSDAQLDTELDRASALGVDFFTTYVRLPDRMQKRVVDYAHALGKPVTSHELYPAVAFGIDGVEHLRGTSRRGYSPKLSATNRAYKDVHRFDREVGHHAHADDRLPGRIPGARNRRQDAALRSTSRSVSVAGRQHAGDLAAARPDAALDLAIKPYEATLKAIVTGGGRSSRAQTRRSFRTGSACTWSSSRTCTPG